MSSPVGRPHEPVNYFVSCHAYARSECLVGSLINFPVCRRSLVTSTPSPFSFPLFLWLSVFSRSLGLPLTKHVVIVKQKSDQNDNLPTFGESRMRVNQLGIIYGFFQSSVGLELFFTQIINFSHDLVRSLLKNAKPIFLSKIFNFHRLRLIL